VVKTNENRLDKEKSVLEKRVVEAKIRMPLSAIDDEVTSTYLLHELPIVTS